MSPVISDAHGLQRTMFHIASSQEALHASILPLTEPTGLPYKLKAKDIPPIQVYSYPLVPATPPFPFLAQAPTSVMPGKSKAIDPYVLSASNISYSRSLALLKREIGPHFDLEKIWGQHIYYVREITSLLSDLCR